ncbi:hypothetical protein [Arthrobacter sp. LjRoot78]|uniref:hypothetical protein n=1 Tax=Arthrobacter sp. LjRoot78 TaxID=3342338 RepID=UPI003F502F9E
MAGSEKTFHAAAVAPAEADSVPDAEGCAPVAEDPGVAPVADADGVPPAVALSDGLLPAVQAGCPLPSPLHPDITAAATMNAAPSRALRAIAFPVMRQE